MAEIGCDAPEGRRKIRQMQTTETKSAGSSIAPVQTATRTDGTTNIDALPVSTTFVARASVSERRPHVEEDSTDIFLLERCSPLNDF
jgi:hypothetical protein